VISAVGPANKNEPVFLTISFSNFDLKPFADFAVTVTSSNKFHFETSQKYFLTSLLHRYFISFKKCLPIPSRCRLAYSSAWSGRLLVMNSCVASPNVTNPMYEKLTLKTAAARCVQSRWRSEFYKSIHTTRAHGPCLRPVFSGAQSTLRVFTGRVYGPRARVVCEDLKGGGGQVRPIGTLNSL